MKSNQGLDDRKMKILQTIIKTYLETGEPVGSRTISKYADLNLSSATIRNEMPYRDHREGPGGPPSGATCPRRLRGPSVGGDQPQVGWCALPQGPKAPKGRRGGKP